MRSVVVPAFGGGTSLPPRNQRERRVRKWKCQGRWKDGRKITEERWKKDDGSRIEWDSRWERNFSTIIKSNEKETWLEASSRGVQRRRHMLTCSCHLSLFFWLRYQSITITITLDGILKEFEKVCNANTQAHPLSVIGSSVELSLCTPEITCRSTCFIHTFPNRGLLDWGPLLSLHWASFLRACYQTYNTCILCCKESEVMWIDGTAIIIFFFCFHFHPKINSSEISVVKHMK